MSESLAREQCQACRPGSPTVHGEEATGLLAEIPGWEIVVMDGMEQLSRTFEFADFAAALAFTNRVGALAEEADHHPAITTEWGRTNVRFWTHSIGGLHRNDFIMAARASEAAE
ncbi:MAG: 4a-hydroxytetrahydrobiopterin dehydratase [Gammaproteobacteria bacterium]|nr:4a-hydroxytetrahydrobiopterin dehydratase [Gammaproteobacteria bacterium]